MSDGLLSVFLEIVTLFGCEWQRTGTKCVVPRADTGLPKQLFCPGANQGNMTESILEHDIGPASFSLENV